MNLQNIAMKTFLESIADGYASRYMDSDVLRHTCFVFPNKRAGTFFLKALRETLPDMGFAPHVTTITDLVTSLSGRIVNTRLDTLFLLHQCYRDIVSPHLTDEGRKEYLSFDAFRRWGETVLSDFNEVDIHLASADEMFKNLFDFRSIASTFLTREQRDLMEEYFGYKVSKQYDDNRFWLEFGDRYGQFDPLESDDDSPRSRFIHIWKVLSPLYKLLHERLAAKGLTTSGGAYRLAVDRLANADEEGPDAVHNLLPFKKMVFIGFNALSMSERRIFSLLKAQQGPDMPDGPESFADFVWDCTGPILSPHRDKNGTPLSPEQDSARRFVAMNMREFPAPEWLMPYLHESSTDRLPNLIRSVAAPSKTMEVKIAADLIGQMRDEIGPKPFEEAKVAMVLPDESLLLPLLYSMPSNIGTANLTMGYPLKLTSVTSFLVLLRRLQLMRRDAKNYKGYAYDEIANILSHPYAQTIIGGETIRRFSTWCMHHHLSVVTESAIREKLGEVGHTLLQPLPADAKPEIVIGYLDNVLRLVDDAIMRRSGNDPMLQNARIERANVTAWRLGLGRLLDAIEEYGVELSMQGTLAEAYRLLQGENVAFEGEPLRGLQVMGTLETRALDFEHIYIVALNDRTLPRRSHQRSFLPNVLRRAYGLPPVNYSESIFAYYFYRMISRARTVTLIYDNRVGIPTGGPSRYLMQLDKIYARGKIRHMEYKFSLSSRSQDGIYIEKTAEIMEILDRYRTPPVSGKKPACLSASALKRYIQCPLKFYLQYVRGLRDDPAPVNAVDAITYGNLIHKAMEILLLPDSADRGRWLDPPKTITESFIDSLIEDKESIRHIVHRLINRDYYHLPKEDEDSPLKPDTEIICDTAVRHIINILSYDRARTPFLLYGCEVKADYVAYPLDRDTVNMTYALDRVDNIGCGDSDNTVRIVDYKTGSSHIEAPSIDSVFDGSSLSDHYFQLQLYADLLNINRHDHGLSHLSVKPVIYPVAAIHKDDKNYAMKRKFFPTIGKNRIDLHDQPFNDTTVDKEFRNRLDNMLEEMFNPDIPFAGVYNEDKCRFCAFKSLCMV